MDIGINGGKIDQIEERIPISAALEIDTTGSLVTTPFANPHLHLCKVYTLPMMAEDALDLYNNHNMGRAMKP